MLGIAFRTWTPRSLDVLWQSRQCVLHAVLRQHLRDVEVSADLERDRDREIAVPSRLTAHIEHVLDAVDLLLERRRDRTRDCFRRCAGIGRRDLHRRRDDLRILRDRQNGERAESKQRHEGAEHGREAGTIDEEMCQAHFERLCANPDRRTRTGSRPLAARPSIPALHRGDHR